MEQGLGEEFLAREVLANKEEWGGGGQKKGTVLRLWLELRRLPQILFYLRSGAYGDFQKSESAPKGYTT